MRVVIAPDSFKGGPAARRVAELLAEGWSGVRPADDVVLLPVADGGEGTLDALHVGVEGADRRTVRGVVGPDGRPVDAEFVLLPDDTGVVELASPSGLPLMDTPDPLNATTYGLGQVLAAALDAGARRLLVGVGGSASTDGGTGALSALGLRLEDGNGEQLPRGGAALARLARIDAAQLRPPPPDGVEVLTDVDNPLLGRRGAAATFGPQKGATPRDVEQLEQALAQFASLAGGDPERPGAGAAGGTSYGLATFWGAELAMGSVEICAVAGIPEALETADVVLTGEGAYDATSLRGKAAGHVIELAQTAGVPTGLVAGMIDDPPPGSVGWQFDLTARAGSSEAAMAQVERLLVDAGGELARRQESSR